MELIYYFTFVSLVHSSRANSTSDVYDVIAPFEDDFTPETYAFFNISKKYKKYDLNEMEGLSRRWALWYYSWFGTKQYYKEELNERVCYFMSTTYLGAMPEIRRYFQRRFLYVNTMEYEIGYLAYNIIYRYQMMVEIYQIVYTKYYLEPWAFKTQITYMFYMYRNLLDYGMNIIHLCNMMHEIEKKYEGQPLGVWDDYPQSREDLGIKIKTNNTKDSKVNLDNYERRRREEYKRRQRERRKNRKQINYGSFKLTTPKRRPKKSFWPLHYGWSIEFW